MQNFLMALSAALTVMTFPLTDMLMILMVSCEQLTVCQMFFQRSVEILLMDN